MPRSTSRPRRDHHKSHAARPALIPEETVRALEIDHYPSPPDPDDGPHNVVPLPYMALTWQYISVFLVVDGTVLLVCLDDGSATDPKVWTAPFGRYERATNPQHCASQTLFTDTGIDLPPERLRLIDNCVVSLAGFAGNTNHLFFVTKWTEVDGTVPPIRVPAGARAIQFFPVADLPVMNPPYAKALIEVHFQR